MINSYRGFSQLSENKFETLWADATIIFDTNILLNLYRYSPTTQKDFFAVLEKLGDRIWIPYHVGLEYHRNRHNVKDEPIEVFPDLKKHVTDALAKISLSKIQKSSVKHIVSDEGFTTAIDKAKEILIDEISRQQKEFETAALDFDVNDKIIELFEGKVGQRPVDQDAVDKLNDRGRSRFLKKIPPGFMDADKHKTEDNSFSDCGVVYEKRYSDFIIWEQILEFAKSLKKKAIIFVSDDAKDDWWLKVGGKTISPRPELVSEIFTCSGAELFHMYNSSDFLRYCKQYNHTHISADTIEEVHLLEGEYRVGKLARFNETRVNPIDVEYSVKEWAGEFCEVYDFDGKSHGFDFFSIFEGDVTYFICKLVKLTPTDMVTKIKKVIIEARSKLSHQFYEPDEEGKIHLVIVVDGDSVVPFRKLRQSALVFEEFLTICNINDLKLTVGFIDDMNKKFENFWTVSSEQHW